jgi:hypothetical protein
VSGAFDTSGGREFIWGMFYFYYDEYISIMMSNMGLCISANILYRDGGTR